MSMVAPSLLLVYFFPPSLPFSMPGQYMIWLCMACRQTGSQHLTRRTVRHGAPPSIASSTPYSPRCFRLVLYNAKGALFL
ncbi:hypothetical protein BKA81DRAFT_366684 [Phyllosticta paracitricarpa]